MFAEIVDIIIAVLSIVVILVITRFQDCRYSLAGSDRREDE
jgi:hypothetical protein